MNSRKWDIGEIAVAVVLAFVALLAFKKWGGVDWTPHFGMISFGKLSGLLLIGAVCFVWFWAGAHTKDTAVATGFFGPHLFALAAIVAVVGLVLIKASHALQGLATILNT